MNDKQHLLQVFDHVNKHNANNHSIVFSVLLLDVPDYGIGYEFIVIDGVNAPHKKQYYEGLLTDDAYFNNSNNNVQIVGCAMCLNELIGVKIVELRKSIIDQLKTVYNDVKNNGVN